MKEKVKNIVLTLSIAYMIIIAVLTLIAYNNCTNVITLNDSGHNKNKLKEYKKEVNSISNSSCRAAINEVIKYYEKTSYDGEVNLQDKFLKFDSVLNYVYKVINDCELNVEERKELSSYALTSSIQFDETALKYYFQYELRIPDILSRSIVEPELTRARYRINRENQLMFIKRAIEIRKERENEE